MLKDDEKAKEVAHKGLLADLADIADMEWEIEDVFRLVAPYVAEFVGTYILVFTVGCNSLTGSPIWMPTSIAFAIMVGMQAMSDVSGGHLNPALTLAFGLSRKLEWYRVWMYIGAQMAGGFLAALSATSMLGKEVIVGPKDGYNLMDAFIVEVVYSTMFCFVALNCMASFRNNPKYDRNQFFPIAVGFVAIAGGHTTGDVSGAFFNPAATLGFGLVSTDADRMWCVIYAGFQCAGSVAAVFLFFMVRPEELVLGLGEGLSCRRACGAISCCGEREHHDHEASEPEEGAVPGLKPEDNEFGPYGEGYVPPMPARLISEFIGTYVVVFTYGLSTVSDAWQRSDLTMVSSTTPAAMDKAEKHESNTIAWATGAAMLSMVYALATVSGAHFNPATTLAVMMSGRGVCSIPEGLTVIVVQAGAALAAAATYLCVQRGQSFTNPLRVVDLGPRGNYTWKSVAIGEMIFTMALALVALCMTTVRSQRYSKACKPRSFQTALAVGMCFTAGSYALEAISGGHLNPAVSLGVSAANFVSSGLVLGDRLSSFMKYAVFQGVGGVLGALVFALMHPKEYKKDPLLRG